MNYFVLLLIIILIVIYTYGFISENFVSGYDANDLLNEPVNYDTRKQNCNELTYTPTECVVDTVIPSNKTVCTKSLRPITNNEIEISNANKNTVKTKNPTLSLKYDFDLLSSFNDAQIDNNNTNTTQQKMNDVNELDSLNELKSDVRSLNSLENDIMSNY
jgi:hypothetical protein